jgi:TolB-like protein/cytochrome c-type biogenesis protein CcmH/NrfG
MPLASGSCLGSYTIVVPLGAGGMGEVYRAHDPRLGRDVALKVLPADMARDPARLERFAREARAIAALNHPHIVTIYSTEEADGIRFLTMELVEGQPLDALIPANGMPLARFLELALPLADALNAAHQKQIVHRDLKPANVMIASNGRLKVLDFGLASAPTANVAPDFSLADLVTSPQVTTPGTIIGTMPYMSPEQVEGKPLDHRTDLFSLGVMFHEMLTGTRPFSGESSPQLMSSILRDTPSSTSDLRADVPEALSRLIARCLEKQPDDRVQTARDIYNELRHVQKQLESGPRPRPDSGSARAAGADSLWLALLPFTTRGADPDGVSLAAGLTEDITAGLARFPSLSVVAHQSALGFKDSPLDIRQIAERLNARYMMSGSVRKSASGVRIAAHLIDARSGAQLWTETYDRRSDEIDIYAIQDDVTDRVVATIADNTGVLARSMIQAIRGLPIEQLSARQLVYRCWGANLSPTAAEHEEVRGALESFLARQPDDAELWAQLSQFYIFEHSLWFWLNPLPEPLVRARRAARGAIELDPSNQEGWVSLGIACFHGRDEAGFLEAVDRVLRLNPRASNAVAWMGNLLTHSGAYDRGCQITERAMALNASHAGWYHFAPFNRAFARGDFDEALKSARRVNIAGFHWMHIAIAAAAGHLGLSAEGAAAVEALATVAPPLRDEHNLREMITRWYWEEEMIESLLEGLRRSMSAPAAADATPVRSRPRSSGAIAPPTRRPPSDAATSSAAADVLSAGIDAAAAVRQAHAKGLRIGVLPFTSRGGDAAVSLADGLTDDITTGLSRFAYLRVLSRAAASRDLGDVSDTRATGVRLGARYLLEGNVRTAGNAVRVTVRLIDTETDANLWADNIDRDAAVIGFALQDEVASRIVATVGDPTGVLAHAMATALADVPLDRLSVAELAIRHSVYLQHLRPEEHARLREAFEHALEREPQAAEGWACLAILYSHEHSLGSNPLPDSHGRHRRAAERSVEIDPGSQTAWLSLTAMHLFARDASALRAAVERTVSLNALNADVLAQCSIYLLAAGEHERASALIQRAMALKPQHPGWYHFTSHSVHYDRGEYEDALREARLINMPGVPQANLAAAISAGQLGRETEARLALDALRRIDPNLVTPENARQVWSLWYWDEAVTARRLEGLEKALALTSGAGSTTGVRPPSDTRPGVIDMSVIVRPFSVRAGDDLAAELAEGLIENITTGLSRFAYLRVRGAAVAGQHTGHAAGGSGPASGVRFIVDGAVKRSGRAVRVNVRLLEAASGTTLWADQYDRDGSADSFTIQDEIGDRVVATLADDGGALYRLFAAAVRTSTDEAHDALRLFVRFAEFVEQFTREEHSRLRDEYQAFVERHPSNATAWAHLAMLYAAEMFFDLNPLPDAVARVRRAADRAVGLDSTNQMAWYALAEAAFFERNAAAFRSAADRAIELNPLRSRNVGAVGLLRAFAGDPAEGAVLVTRAISLNPRHPGWFHLALFLDAFQRGDAERALGEAARANAPQLPVDGRLFTIAAAGRFGRAPEAAAAINELRRDYPHLLDARRAREEWAIRIWDGDLLDSLVDGFEAALMR